MPPDRVPPEVNGRVAQLQVGLELVEGEVVRQVLQRRLWPELGPNTTPLA